MTLYPYNRDIPDAPDNPSDEQPDMKINTNSADDLINEDHFSFNQANGGLHKQVRMPFKVAIPGGLIPFEGTLYTKFDGVATQLFYTPDISGNEFLLTRTSGGSFANFAKFVPGVVSPATAISNCGWTFLPGGLLLQYGTVTGLGVSNLPNTATVTFPTPYIVGIFSITLTVRRNDPENAQNSLSRTLAPNLNNFTYSLSSSTADAIYWMAIGI